MSDDLRLRNAAEFVQALMFLDEFIRQSSRELRQEFQPISFFMNRQGGFQLLILLLNAAYQKPAVNRAGGWPFGALSPRINISERALRTLLKDAVESGFIQKTRFEIDHRYNVYCLEEHVVSAWDKLFHSLQLNLTNVFRVSGPNTLANIDYADLHTETNSNKPSTVSPVVKYLKSSLSQGARRNRMKEIGYGKPKGG